MRNEERISKKTIERLTLYLKCLDNFSDEEYISSEELGVLLGVTASQVRKDLSYFINSFDNFLGKRGKGYSVKNLKEILEKILGLNKKINVIIVGANSLSNGILEEANIDLQKFNIVGIFDIRKNKLESEHNGVKIFNISDIPRVVESKNVDIAIITEEEKMIQPVTDIVVKAGVSGIINMTSKEIKVPLNVIVEQIDINRKLQEINYWKEKVK